MMVTYHGIIISKFTKVQGTAGWFKNGPCQCRMQVANQLPFYWWISFHSLRLRTFILSLCSSLAMVKNVSPSSEESCPLRLRLSMYCHLVINNCELCNELSLKQFRSDWELLYFWLVPFIVTSAAPFLLIASSQAEISFSSNLTCRAFSGLYLVIVPRHCTSNFDNNNNNNNNGLISVHPWYGSSPDIKVKWGNENKSELWICKKLGNKQ